MHTLIIYLLLFDTSSYAYYERINNNIIITS